MINSSCSRIRSARRVLVVLAVAVLATSTWAQPMTVPPPTLSDFARACAPFNTSFTCARAVNAICLWDSGSNTCGFRSKSCPADIKEAMISISNCGATMNQSCPDACLNPQLTYVARLHVHAGLNNYTRGDTLLSMAATNPMIAQTIADVQYCTTELTATQYTYMLMVGCNPTPEQYNTAIAAAISNSPGVTPPASSPWSSSPPSSKSSTSSAAIGSPTVLSINMVINGLALGLFIMYAADM